MKETTLTINKFFGLHQDSTSGLIIKPGELSVLKNIYITENHALKKREGYIQAILNTLGGTIRGLWYGEVANRNVLLVAANGNIYEFEEDEIQ